MLSVKLSDRKRLFLLLLSTYQITRNGTSHCRRHVTLNTDRLTVSDNMNEPNKLHVWDVSQMLHLTTKCPVTPEMAPLPLQLSRHDSNCPAVVVSVLLSFPMLHGHIYLLNKPHVIATQCRVHCDTHDGIVWFRSCIICKFFVASDVKRQACQNQPLNHSQFCANKEIKFPP